MIYQLTDGKRDEKKTFKTLKTFASKMKIGETELVAKSGTKGVNRGFILVKRQTNRWVKYSRFNLRKPGKMELPKTCTSLQLS